MQLLNSWRKLENPRKIHADAGRTYRLLTNCEHVLWLIDFFSWWCPNIVCEHLFIVHYEWSSSWPSPRLLGDSPRSLECATLWFENVVSLRSVMLLARTQMQHNFEVNHSLNWNIVNRWKDYHNNAGSTWAKPGPWVLCRADGESVVWGGMLVGLTRSKMQKRTVQLVRVPTWNCFFLFLTVFGFRHHMRFLVTSV